MKNMKRRIATCACALAVLVWICAPVRAEYLGTLPKDQDWSLQVANSSTDSCAATVYSLDKRGLDVIEVISVASAASVEQ